MTTDLLKILFKNINIEGLIFDTLDEVLEPALQKVVDDTANPIDNMLMMAYPFIETEVKKLVTKKLQELILTLTAVEVENVPVVEAEPVI